MNISIKSLFLLILVISYNLIEISSQEFVITIPEGFNTTNLPLPPFPEETINRIEIEDYDNLILDSLSPRINFQDDVEYFFYDGFLNKNINNKSFFDNSFIAGYDKNYINIGYNPEYYNNNFSIMGYFTYGIASENYVIKGKYIEYRLPLKLKVEVDINELSLNIGVGYKDFYRSWSVNPEISSSSNSISLYYKDDKFIKPYTFFSINEGLENFGLISFGYNSFRLGTTFINLCFLPYLEFNRSMEPINLVLNTSVNSEYVDYSFDIIYRNLKKVSLGAGIKITENYNDFLPYLSVSENFIFGVRDYTIFTDSVNFKWSFIKDDFISIISIDLNSFEFYSFEIELNYKNFGINSSFTFSKSDENIIWGLLFNYKGGNK